MQLPEEYGLTIAKSAVEAATTEGVDKIVSAMGVFFPFWGAKKIAVDTYIHDIQCSNLSPESKMMAIANVRKTYKQLNNQIRIAQIAQDAAKPETDFSSGSNVDDEWLERYMDSARFVSDEKMQILWGNILAKEFEKPNSTPPSIIRILTEITPRYARIFEALCSLAVSFVFIDDNGAPKSKQDRIFMPENYEYLFDYDITLSTINELQSLGLLQYEPSGMIITYNNLKLTKFHLVYNNQVATIVGFTNKQFPAGTIRLTDAGEVIAKFVTKQAIPNHFETVKEYLKKKNVKFTDIPELAFRDNH